MNHKLWDKHLLEENERLKRDLHLTRRLLREQRQRADHWRLRALQRPTKRGA